MEINKCLLKFLITWIEMECSHGDYIYIIISGSIVNVC